VDRSKWTLASSFHIAETEDEAYRQVEYGIERWFDYFQHVAAFPQMSVKGGNIREMISFINDNGVGVIGTAEQARKQIERLWDQSGGFGSLLVNANDWANTQDTLRSAEIFAQEVFPYFQGQAEPTLRAEQLARQTRDGHNQSQLDAVAHMTQKYQNEIAAKS
jgi:limonene 1,2-monooxygenase